MHLITRFNRVDQKLDLGVDNKKFKLLNNNIPCFKHLYLLMTILQRQIIPILRIIQQIRTLRTAQ